MRYKTSRFHIVYTIYGQLRNYVLATMHVHYSRRFLHFLRCTFVENGFYVFIFHIFMLRCNYEIIENLKRRRLSKFKLQYGKFYICKFKHYCYCVWTTFHDLSSCCFVCRNKQWHWIHHNMSLYKTLTITIIRFSILWLIF